MIYEGEITLSNVFISGNQIVSITSKKFNSTATIKKHCK